MPLFFMENIRDFQAVMYSWQSKVMPGVSIESRVLRAGDEFHETMEELEAYDGSPEAHKRLAKEIVDTIIALTGALVTMGVDLASELTAKLTVIFQKYNPHKHAELVAEGHSHESALGELKKRWRQ